MKKSEHWACKLCIVRPCCTEVCYKGNMIHFLCEDCKRDCNVRVSTHTTRWGTYGSCEAIRQHEVFQRLGKIWVKEYIKHWEDTSLIGMLMKMLKQQPSKSLNFLNF